MRINELCPAAKAGALAAEVSRRHAAHFTEQLAESRRVLAQLRDDGSKADLSRLAAMPIAPIL